MHSVKSIALLALIAMAPSQNSFASSDSKEQKRIAIGDLQGQKCLSPGLRVHFQFFAEHPELLVEATVQAVDGDIVSIRQDNGIIRSRPISQVHPLKCLYVGQRVKFQFFAEHPEFLVEATVSALNGTMIEVRQDNGLIRSRDLSQVHPM